MKEKFDFSIPEDQEKFEKLPKKEKDNIITQNQSEANVLKGNIKLGRAKNYDEASEKFDEPLLSNKILNRPKFSLQNLKIVDERNETLYSHDTGYHRCFYGFRDDYGFNDLLEYDENYNEEYNEGREKNQTRNKIRANKMFNCDKIRITHPDYEKVRDQNIFIKTNGNLIMLYSKGNLLDEMYMSIKNFRLQNLSEEIMGKEARYENHIREAKKIFAEHSRKEIDENSDLQEIIKKGYDSLFQDGAIIAEKNDGAKKFIEEELGKGTYIVDALKKAEEKKLLKIRNIPTFYTNTEEMKKREDEINEMLDAKRDEVETEIRSDMENEVNFQQEKNKRRQVEREVKEKIIEEKYGNIFNEKGNSLGRENLSALRGALLLYNNDKPHSPYYREYERTEGLDIKDNIAVFVAEESSLNLEGKGGEEIDIKLVLVKDGNAKEIKEFHVRDRWDKRKDNFRKWYRDVEIDKFDKEGKQISLKLKNKDGEVTIEEIDLTPSKSK